MEYRLGPVHKFPANHDDAKCVVDWVAANKSKVGERLSLMGIMISISRFTVSTSTTHQFISRIYDLQIQFLAIKTIVFCLRSVCCNNGRAGYFQAELGVPTLT